MRRIVQCEFDSYFFKLFGQYFLKSFYEHNKGWELYVVDLGLDEDDREILSRYGAVEEFPIDPGSRWPNLTGRILSLAKLVRDDNLIMRFDTDSIIMASYDDIIEQFLIDRLEIAAPLLPHSLAQRARNLPRAAELLGVSTDHPCLHERAMTACFSLIKGTPRIAKSFEWLSEHYEQLIFAAKEEEPIISAVMYRDGIRTKALPWSVFWSNGMDASHFTYLVPSMFPINTAGERVRGVHFAFSKYFMLNSAAVGGHEGWCGWRDLVSRKYDNMPWPNPKVIGHRS